MKQLTACGILLLAFGSHAYSQNLDEMVFENRSIGFIAPQIIGHTNVDDPQKGEIVFDTDSGQNKFWGYDGTSWNEIGFGSGITSSPQSFSGVKTFSDGIKVDDAADQSVLNFYRQETISSTFTFDGTSGGTSSSVNVIATRIGSTIMVWVPSVTATSGTSSSNLNSNTDLPSWARPTNSLVIWCGATITNNVENETERVNFAIGSNGNIAIRREMGAWANSTPNTGSSRGCMLSWDTAS